MIVGSSLWSEPDWVVKVFLTMLAVKDADHVVRMTAYQLAQFSKKTEKEAIRAIKILSSPDKRRVEPQLYDGRRIKKVEEGWLVLNGDYYRNLMRVEMKRARNRRAQANHRARRAGREVPYPKVHRAPTAEEQRAIDEARAKAVDANKAAYQAGQEWKEAEAVLETAPEERANRGESETL
jgi:hypothetical protein